MTMFQNIKGFKKDDLKYVAQEIGETLSQNITVAGLKNLILESREYREDPGFVQELLVVAIDERKLKEKRDFERVKLEEEKTKRDFEEEKAKRAHEIEMARIQAQNQGVTFQPNFTPDVNISRRKYSLPKLEFRHFGDDIKDWLPFWSQFQQIHNDEDIAPEDKFQYLIQATVVGSRAREVVESFPPTGANYSKAVDSLKSRFGREDILIEVYIREVLKLIISVQTKETFPLTFLYDKLESYLRALETLGITTDLNASILYPMVESCFPADFLKAWNRSNISNTSTDAKERLNNLMQFLKKEVEGEERINLAIAGFGLGKSQDKPINRKNHSSDHLRNKLPTAAGLLTNTSTVEVKKSCIFCEGKHMSSECFSAQKMSLSERQKIVKDKRCCFACLTPGHCAKRCRVLLKCVICGRKHVPLMCCSLAENNRTVPKKEDSTPEKEVSLSNIDQNPKVYLQTLKAKLISDDKEMEVRLLLDSGSQKSYILKDVAEKMKYTPLRQETITHSLFGGITTQECKHHNYRIRLGNLNGKFRCNFEVLDQKTICDNVPSVGRGLWLQELKQLGIILTDVHNSSDPSSIQVLVGADVLGKLLTGRREILSSGLVAIETLLGWTLMGKIPQEELSKRENSTNLAISLFVNEASISDLWKLDLIGISDPFEKDKDKAIYSNAIKQFNESVTVLPSGRYEVNLPFKDEINLPSNESLTVKRFKNMCKGAVAHNYLKDYIAVFEEWEKLEIIEKIPEKEAEQYGHYLPHRPVIKENINENSQSMKIRPVFDASARDGQGPSLNDCLIKGPNLIELIPDVLDRFRTHPIGVIADIEKAYLQLSVIPEHRDFLRFFFPCEKEEEKKYRHCRVVFGVSSSPFLLAASLNHLLDNAPDKLKSTSLQLKQSFYVDNCVTGVHTVEELEVFIEKATELMSLRCFNLRGWESNVSSKSVTKSSGVTSLLGLEWNLDKDSLNCKFKLSAKEKSSKRSVLATVQQIFDPVGVLCPATLIPKLILQDMWKINLTWDAVLPEDFQRRIDKWLEEVNCLEDINVPRFIEVNANSEFHVFVDACKTAYAACLFVRTETTTGVKVQLLRARSRVAPIKQITIPRLELIACTLGSRLAHSVQLALDIPADKFVFWSDSMVALWWIKKKGAWSTFVENRVREINYLFPSGIWRHVPGDKNIADIPSRGCSPRKLYELKWWEGPEWLCKDEEDWPIDELEFQNSDVNIERKKVKLTNMCLQEEDIPWYAKRFSNFLSIIRLVAWILRFVNNSRKKLERKLGELSTLEINEAEKVLIRVIQSKHLSSKNLESLMHTFVDNDGIIRVKTRITERIDQKNFLSPIVLPDKCMFTRHVIEHFHKINCHAGTQILLSILREKFWIIRGRKTIRQVLKYCVRCKRYTAKALESAPAPLPANRVNDTAVFEIVGVDLAGPLFVKGDEKTWMVLFTCAVYRAIHLELISSLSTDAFILSLRRFIARRGRPHIIYSDNGTNFKGTYGELSDIDWSKVMYQDEIKPIIWKFNPPSAAWWGGFWERLVRSVKELIRRTLGKAILNFEELQTVLCDCESIINSRPLTYLSEDPNDLVPLTPSMFLRENHCSLVSDIDLCDAHCLRRRVKYRMKLISDLRKRFRKEYLGILIEKGQQKDLSRELNLNEIVLIGDDTKRRIHWPLGIITELIPGKDGKVRTVKIKTRSGILIRPIQRVFPLEVKSSETIELGLRSMRSEDSTKKTSSTCDSSL